MPGPPDQDDEPGRSEAIRSLVELGLRTRNDRHKSWPPILEDSPKAKTIAATISLLLIAGLIAVLTFALLSAVELNRFLLRAPSGCGTNPQSLGGEKCREHLTKRLRL